MNRDFKGVWIPKELWLNKDLTMLEKVIFVEIDSLDNENHCTAGNDYFAEFCSCSESKVTKAIKKLQDLNMIEVISFNGRIRTMRVVKNDNQSSKKYEAESQKVRPININNNTTNKNDILSKDNISSVRASAEFDFGNVSETKKPNLYQKCSALIDSWTDIASIRTLLYQYLDVCMEMKNIRGANQWKGMLNTLERVQKQCHPHTFEEIIIRSIDHGWKTFYPIDDSGYKPKTKSVKNDIERIGENDYDKYDRTISEREF